MLLVPGASHHFWTHPPQPTDSLYVVKARLQIADFVSKALAEPVADLFKGERAVARGSERAGQKHYTSDPTDWMLDNKRLPGVPLHLAPPSVPPLALLVSLADGCLGVGAHVGLRPRLAQR